MSFEKFSLADALEDLSSRFIINVTESELSKTERICFHIEQAHWFYEDFVREQNPALPHLELDRFMQHLFQHCKSLGVLGGDPHAAYASFRRYKRTVPVCGVIILNQKMDKVLLVRQWTSKTWSFPMGKINEAEEQVDCAVREVEEETGFNCSRFVYNDAFLEKSISGKEIRLYFAAGVPESTEFKTQTRKEISGIRWFNVAALQVDKRKLHQQQIQQQANVSAASSGKSKFYLVNSFADDIIKWCKENRKRVAAKEKLNTAIAAAAVAPRIEESTTSVTVVVENTNMIMQQMPYHPPLHMMNIPPQPQFIMPQQPQPIMIDPSIALKAAIGVGTEYRTATREMPRVETLHSARDSLLTLLGKSSQEPPPIQPAVIPTSVPEPPKQVNEKQQWLMDLLLGGSQTPTSERTSITQPSTTLLPRPSQTLPSAPAPIEAPRLPAKPDSAALLDLLTGRSSATSANAATTPSIPTASSLLLPKSDGGLLSKLTGSKTADVLPKASESVIKPEPDNRLLTTPSSSSIPPNSDTNRDGLLALLTGKSDTPPTITPASSTLLPSKPGLLPVKRDSTKDLLSSTPASEDAKRPDLLALFTKSSSTLPSVSNNTLQKPPPLLPPSTQPSPLAALLGKKEDEVVVEADEIEPTASLVEERLTDEPGAILSDSPTSNSINLVEEDDVNADNGDNSDIDLDSAHEQDDTLPYGSSTPHPPAFIPLFSRHVPITSLSKQASFSGSSSTSSNAPVAGSVNINSSNKSKSKGTAPDTINNAMPVMTRFGSASSDRTNNSNTTTDRFQVELTSPNGVFMGTVGEMQVEHHGDDSHPQFVFKLDANKIMGLPANSSNSVGTSTTDADDDGFNRGGNNGGFEDEISLDGVSDDDEQAIGEALGTEDEDQEVVDFNDFEEHKGTDDSPVENEK
ncbi:hypothetical protein SmJEL517_g01584 [Synchytrium microbalum]|uniref:Nudix hydrolase domain-containing protein n=1 Tax=Synchytrium microbalum TaxID=1806994 RepID=A0A507C9T7_9FUNG|nr:uncharacterized protein SmJEL517_g01584 [Synchytrium microbalum]TPX36241.1 hypothetical protein SmJEL517_g01584 [Synchytrium microbalum]